jgi:transposase-like protein
MKKTHRFQSLGDVAAVISAAPNIAAAARQLGVDRSSVSRWIKAGKIQRPVGVRLAAPPTNSPITARAGNAPQRERTSKGGSWARWVRRTYDLSATDETLVDLADRALAMARNAAVAPEVQLRATARYQALVRQLNLEQEPADGEAEKAQGGRFLRWPRRVDGTAAGA